MIGWLDGNYQDMPRSHRALLQLEEHIEIALDELFESDRMLQRSLTPSEEVTAHRLGLRINDKEVRMHRAWTHPLVRRSSLMALRGIHERYLGPIPASRERPVLFEVTQRLHNPDFSGYVEAHRLEFNARRLHLSTGYQDSIRAVKGPLWVHDLYANLTDDGLRGEKLRTQYLYRYAERYQFRQTMVPPFVGKASTEPGSDTLEAALLLWVPDEPGAPYSELRSAVEAATLL